MAFCAQTIALVGRESASTHREPTLEEVAIGVAPRTLSAVYSIYVSTTFCASLQRVSRHANTKYSYHCDDFNEFLYGYIDIAIGSSWLRCILWQKVLPITQLWLLMNSSYVRWYV